MGLFDKVKEAVQNVFGGSSNDTSSSSSGFSVKVDSSTPKTVSGGSSVTRTASAGRNSSSSTGVSVSNPSGNKGTIDISSPPNLGKTKNPLHAAVRTASAKRKMDEAANALNQAQTNLGYADQWNEADLRRQMEEAQKAYDEAKAAYEEETAPKYKSSEDLNTKAEGATTSETLNGQTLAEQKRPMTGNSMSEALANSRRQEDTNIFRQDVADVEEEEKPSTPHNSLLDAVLTKPNGDRYNSLYDKILAEQPESLPIAPAPMEVPQMNGRKGPLTMEQTLAHQTNSSWRNNLTQDRVKEEAQAAPQDVNTPKTPDFIQTNEERDALISELRGMGNPNYLSAADRKAYIDHRNEIRDRLDAIDEQLGNGHMDYTFGDRLSSVLSGSVKGYGGDLLNSAATVAEGMSQLGEQLGGDTGEYAGWATDEVSRAAIPYESDEEKYAQQRQEVADIQKVADDLAQDSAEDINRAKNGVGGVGRFAIDVGTNAIQMGMDGLAAVLTGGGSLAPMFFRTMGGSAREARRDGANIGQQILYGTVKGGIEVATEKVFDGLAGVYGKGTADEAVEKLIQKLGHGNDAQMTALRVFFSGLGEAAEEGMSGAADPFTQMIYQGVESFPKNANADWLSDTLYSMAVGFAMGSAGGGVNIVNGENARLNADAKSQIDAVEQMNQRGAQAQPVTENTAESAPEETPRAPSPIKPSSLEETDSGTRAADAPVQQTEQTATEAEAETEATPTITPDTRSGEQVTVEPTLSRTSKPETAEQPTTPANPLVDQPTTTAEAESTEEEAPETPKRTVEEIDAEIAPIQAEIAEIDNLIAENQEAARQQASQQPTLAEAQAIQQQAQTVVDSLNEQKAPLQERVNALTAERRAVTSEQNRAAEQKRWENREAKGAKKVPNPQPETHIDNRTTESVSKSNVNAFQYDNPEVKPFYKRAAEVLMRDLGYMQSSKRSERGNGTVFGASNQFLEKVSSYFGSLNDAIEACEQIIYDKGRENFADPKRIELFLDEMLSNGYEPVDTSLPIIQSSSEYLALKGNLQGGTQYDPRARAIRAEMDSDFTGSMTEAEAGEIVDRNYAETGFYDPYTRDGQTDTSVNDGRQSFEEIDAADTASVEAKYGRSNTTENAQNTAESASEPSQSADTPTTGETASTGETDELNSKPVSQPAENSSETKMKPSQTSENSMRKTAEANGAEQETLYYPVKTEQESLNNAMNRVAADRVGEMDNLINKEMWTGEDIDTAMTIYGMLKNDSVKTHDSTAADIWAKIVQEYGTRSGQALQAFAKWARTGKAATMDIDAQIDADETLTDEQKQKVKEAVHQFSEEYDSLTDETSEEQLDKLRKLILKQNDYRRTGTLGNKNFEKLLNEETDFNWLKEYAIRQMHNIPADFTERPTLAQRVKTWQVNSQLTRLGTFFRNLGGNATFGVIDTAAQDAFGVALDNFVSKFTGKREVTLDKGWLSSDARKAAVKAAQRSVLEVAGDVDMTGDANRYGQGSSRTNKMTGNAAERFMSRWEQLLGYSLTTSDRFFRGQIEQSYAEGLMAQGMEESEARALAKQMADYRLFQNDGIASGISKGAHNLLNLVGFGGKVSLNAHGREGGFGVGDLINPYPGVPANLAVKALEYSPANMVKGAIEMVKVIQDAKAGKAVSGQQMQAVMDFARGATGAPIVALFTVLAKSGLFKNSDDEDDYDVAAEQAAQGLSGVQWNLSATMRALNNEGTEWRDGDDLMKVSWLEPMNAFMGIGSLIADSYDDQSLSTLTGLYFQGALQSAMDLPLMENIQNAINTFNYSTADNLWGKAGDAVAQYAGSTASGMIPAPVSQIARVTDDYYRDATGDTKAETAWNNLLNGIPGARNSLPVKTDNFGNPKLNEPNALLRALNSFVLPGNINTFMETSAQREIARLYDVTGDVGLYPDRKGPKSISVGDTDYKLSADDARAYHEFAGQKSEQYINALINSDVYAELDDQEKRAAIKECYSLAKDQAKDRYLAENGIESDSRSDADALLNGVDNPGTSYDKSALIEQNLADYVSFKTGFKNAIKNNDYDTLDKMAKSFDNLSDNMKEVALERVDDLDRILEYRTQLREGAETFYTVKQAVKDAQALLDANANTSATVRLAGIANADIPEKTKAKIIQNLMNGEEGYIGSNGRAAYTALSKYGISVSETANFFYNAMNCQYWKDSGEKVDASGKLAPANTAYALSQMKGLTDAERSQIYNEIKTALSNKYNDWGTYSYSSELRWFTNPKNKVTYRSTSLPKPGKKNVLVGAKSTSPSNPLTGSASVRVMTGTDKTKVTVSGRK